ncbi:hypothetical protein GGR28_002492 [Lewinella aquimaris]|uniref:Uncharacterized protein n=1 Tax=Neolewinella aquimaris TaxID=1835722 RepID=A0A840E8E7_9BACT|nr:hypothetical protein [Neolewinella aquimaris]MBB4079865.1 hypothetical protein [Neolewinella aquimaris]
MHQYKALASITDVLLDDATGPELLRETIDEYRDLLLTASGIDLGGAEAIDHFNTGTGVAIGATWAALCVDDLIRTQRFVSGLYRAVQDVIVRRSGPVHVLYAGTGPFATLALPLMTRFTPEQLQFTCLEITDASFLAVRQLFSALDLERYVIDVIQTDASTFRIAGELPVDIMLSETMQYCLIDEMQVPIALNLMAQLPPETIMIPERITLRLAVLEDTKDQPVATDLGTIFTVDRASLQAYRAEPESTDWPTVRLPVPMLPPSSRPGPLAIRTLIDVYGSIGLTDYESGLTIPKIIDDYPDELNPLEAIDFTYQLTPSPLLWMDFVLPLAPLAVA